MDAMSAMDVAGALREKHGRKLDDDLSELPPLPLLNRFHHMQHYYGELRATEHIVRYEDRNLDGGQATVLDQNNTAPLRIIPDFNQMDPNKATPYRSCFTEGAYFKWGHPTSTNPASAPSSEVCNRNLPSGSQNCWGVCLSTDLITTTTSQYLQTWVNDRIAHFANVLRAPKRSGNLVFVPSAGVYEAYYQQIGLPDATTVSCLADCSKGNGIPIDPSYCSGGVDGDVILFVSQMIPEPGVGGYGGFCANDVKGKPNAMYSKLFTISCLRSSMCFVSLTYYYIVQISVPSDPSTRTSYVSNGIIQKIM